MYNVIVADDEKNIREGIVELIEWEKLGCKVCASMQNGAQVLKYLEEEKIHVDNRYKDADYGWNGINRNA